MASSALLSRLQQRASQSELIIGQLRAQLVQLRQTAVTNAYNEEEERLTSENEKLRQEVLLMKEQLTQAEIRNGVKQVAMPSADKTALQPSVPVITMPTSAEKPKPQKQLPEKKDKKKKEAKQPQQPTEDKPIDVSRLNMKVGHIVSAKLHPDADTLYVEEVDLGEDRNRTIVSGLVKHVPLEKMQNRMAIFSCNLKPAKMRGILSEGMIMCASSPEQVEIIDPPAGVVKGERVTVDGFPGEPDTQLNPKKKLWEQIQPDLKISSEGLATYKGALWRIGDKGTCKAPSMTNSAIK